MAVTPVRGFSGMKLVERQERSGLLSSLCPCVLVLLQLLVDCRCPPSEPTPCVTARLLRSKQREGANSLYSPDTRERAEDFAILSELAAGHDGPASAAARCCRRPTPVAGRLVQRACRLAQGTLGRCAQGARQAARTLHQQHSEVICIVVRVVLQRRCTRSNGLLTSNTG